MVDLTQRDRTGFVVTAVCDANRDNAELLASEVEASLGNKPIISTDYQKMLTAEKDYKALYKKYNTLRIAIFIILKPNC